MFSPGIWCNAAPLATDQDAFRLDAMAAITAVDHGEAGPRIGQDRDLFQRWRQGVTIIGIAREAASPKHEATVEGGGEADLGAELITHPGLALSRPLKKS